MAGSVLDSDFEKKMPIQQILLEAKLPQNWVAIISLHRGTVLTIMGSLLTNIKKCMCCVMHVSEVLKYMHVSCLLFYHLFHGVQVNRVIRHHFWVNPGFSSFTYFRHMTQQLLCATCNLPYNLLENLLCCRKLGVWSCFGRKLCSVDMILESALTKYKFFVLSAHKVWAHNICWITFLWLFFNAKCPRSRSVSWSVGSYIGAKTVVLSSIREQS